MDFLAIIISLAILVYSSILHEIAHGYVAYRLGDPTAKLKGRLTLNPIPHIDPFYSILMPILSSFSGIIIGGAKPVPVDPFNLREGFRDLAIVSLAGPLTNLVLAIITSVIAHAVFPQMGLGEIAASGIGGFITAAIIQLNILLAVFNLLPIPPLDGSKLITLLLSPKQAAAYLSLESIGLFLILGIFMLGGFTYLTLLIRFAESLLGF
jgi:Zn-dependent protease